MATSADDIHLQQDHRVPMFMFDGLLRELEVVAVHQTYTLGISDRYLQEVLDDCLLSNVWITIML